MKTTLYKASERGSADYGWLKANYSFSFANYYNPQALSFGALRVLNDDIIQGGMGFGTHPHDNMEIITIPLKGALKHRDSMTNEWIPIKTGEVQVMSAGSGIHHAEMNNSSTEDLNLFQIWILPQEQNVVPIYDQKFFDSSARLNKLQYLVSPIHNKIEGTLTIHQNAFISRIDLDNSTQFKYELTTENQGVFLLTISGNVIIGDTELGQRDAIGIEQTKGFKIIAKKDSELLLIETPMKF
jgi:redox-sensitive bicupin YhaK (pirin superfamily)